MKKLKISDNKRFLVYEDGKPFFYLGDTAWEIFHRLNEVQAQRYLINRAAKGFNVIQAVVLSEVNGIIEPNANGHLPLIDMDPCKPNEDYFKHVDSIIDFANSLGMYIGLLPCWGYYVWGEKKIFDENRARQYGRFLGQRYKDKGVIWILGGDRPVEGAENVWGEMAYGIKEGDQGSHLITFHPYGGRSSSEHLHNAWWLDFNMVQSGHSRHGNSNYLMIKKDYELEPKKPVIDGEPCYENIPVAFNDKNGRFTDYDCRMAAYWSVFSGAFGHTYGCNDIWQMYDGKHEPLAYANTLWNNALNFPGSYQMRYLKNLMLSRPFTTRIPDPSLVYGKINELCYGADYQAATRDGTPGVKNATYIMVYRPLMCYISVDTSYIAGDKIRVWWYDPKNGIAYSSPIIDNPKKRFEGLWNYLPWHDDIDHTDWVLVIDDASCNYPAPGTPLAEQV